MSSSSIQLPVFQAKVSNIQNQADSSSIYSSGQWSFKNSTAVASVTITDAGNVGIGTASPTGIAGYAAVTTNGTSGSFSEYRQNGVNYLRIGSDGGSGFINGAGGVLRFLTSDAERMRIDASGNLLVGKTASNFLTVGAQLNTTGAVWGSTGGNADAIAGYNKTTLTQQVIYAGYSDIGGVGSSKFAVFADGNVRIAAGSTYGNFSDIKFKENIVDATPKLEDVLRLQVRNFTIKNEGLKAIGFIAQEFEQVFPALVVTSPDKDMEGNELGTESKAIKESALIPVLVKAIQEQQAQIEEMKAKLAALEAK